MGFKNLGEFLKALREEGELVEVKAPVDPVLEVTEIYDRVVKKKGRRSFSRMSWVLRCRLRSIFSAPLNAWPWRSA